MRCSMQLSHVEPILTCHKCTYWQVNFSGIEDMVCGQSPDQTDWIPKNNHNLASKGRERSHILCLLRYWYERDVAKKLYRNIKSKIAIVISSGRKKRYRLQWPCARVRCSEPERLCLMKLQAKTRQDMIIWATDEIACLGKMPSPNVGGPLSFLQVLNMDYGVSVHPLILSATHILIFNIDILFIQHCHCLIRGFLAFTRICYRSLISFDMLQWQRILANPHLFSEKM